MSFTIYPAIDLRAGKVVRLKEGDPERITSYGDDPAQTARRWLSLGAQWLHVVDLDGAFAESDLGNRRVLRAILDVAAEFDALIQFGGGLRSMDDIQRTVDLGVRRVVLGTIAVVNPTVVANALRRYGEERIAIGIDARHGFVHVQGWKSNTGLSALDLALRMRTLGLRTAIFTDIHRDGLGSGLNIAATSELAEVSGLEVIASGGVNTLSDIIAARDAGLSGVVIGRALYEGTVDLKAALQTSGANLE